MLSAPSPVRAQLSEALTLISGHDFPARWRGLLPELCERLTSSDPAAVNGVLETANSIFKRCTLLRRRLLPLLQAREHAERDALCILLPARISAVLQRTCDWLHACAASRPRPWKLLAPARL